MMAENITIPVKAVEIRAELRQIKAVQDTISKFRGVLVDKAVLALERGVLKGEQWAVTFTLSRLGKDRGYVERQELSVDISQVDDAIERQLERLAPPGES